MTIDLKKAGQDIEAMKLRLQQGDERMARMEKAIRGNTEEIQRNTEMTAASQSDIAEILDIFKSFKGGLKVLGWLGNGAKWVTSVGGAIAVFGAAIAAFYAAIKGGGPHP